MSDVVERNWGGLRWSAWMPLMAAHPLALAQLPNCPGLFRLRRAGDETLLWLGRADSDVRAAGERLSRQVHLPNEPYDEPGGPAAMLRQLRRAGIACEISGVPLVDGSARTTTERELRTVARLPAPPREAKSCSSGPGL